MSGRRPPTVAIKVPSPVSKHHPNSEVTRSRHQSDDARSTASAMSALTVSGQPTSEDARFHQLLAVLPGTVEDHLRDSLLATYLSLDQSSRANCPDAALYEGMLRKTQRHLFNDQLISQGISGLLQSSPLDSELADWSMKLFDEIPVNDIKFAISGHHLSGKTLLLSAAASTFYRRLLDSADRDNYLVFPWNLAPHSLLMDRPSELYPVIINLLFDAVRYIRFEIFPYLLPLRQWFLSAPNIGTMSKPPPLLESLNLSALSSDPNFDPDGLERVDVNAITELGRICHGAFHKQVDRSVSSDASYKRQDISLRLSDQDFMDLIFSLPGRIAAALNLKGTVFILDHIDQASPEVARALSRVLHDSPFLIACQNQREFKKLYKLRTAVELLTDNCISYEFPYHLVVPDLRARIGVANLMGCPGFIVSFVKVCKMLIDLDETLVVKDKEAFIRSKVDAARRSEAAQEVKRLFLALAGANNPIINYELVNQIAEGQFVMKVDQIA
jgi:hypothetical protein